MKMNQSVFQGVTNRQTGHTINEGLLKLMIETFGGQMPQRTYRCLALLHGQKVLIEFVRQSLVGHLREDVFGLLEHRRRMRHGE